jgi:hypothetical protein
MPNTWFYVDKTDRLVSLFHEEYFLGNENNVPFSYIFPFRAGLGAFAKFRKANISFFMSLCLSVCLSLRLSLRPSVLLPVRPHGKKSVSTERISMKFHIRIFFASLSRKSNYLSNMTRITDTLHTYIRAYIHAYIHIYIHTYLLHEAESVLRI